MERSFNRNAKDNLLGYFVFAAFIYCSFPPQFEMRNEPHHRKGVCVRAPTRSTIIQGTCARQSSLCLSVHDTFERAISGRNEQWQHRPVTSNSSCRGVDALAVAFSRELSHLEGVEDDNDDEKINRLKEKMQTFLREKVVTYHTLPFTPAAQSTLVCLLEGHLRSLTFVSVAFVVSSMYLAVSSCICCRYSK